MQLPAATTLDQASMLLGLLDKSLAETEAAALRIDASALREFDTSALALLLEAQRRIKLQGGSLVVVGAPSKLIELARLYGVDQLLSLEAAAVPALAPTAA